MKSYYCFKSMLFFFLSMIIFASLLDIYACKTKNSNKSKNNELKNNIVLKQVEKEIVKYDKKNENNNEINNKSREMESIKQLEKVLNTKSTNEKKIKENPSKPVKSPEILKKNLKNDNKTKEVTVTPTKLEQRPKDIKLENVRISESNLQREGIRTIKNSDLNHIANASNNPSSKNNNKKETANPTQSKIQNVYPQSRSTPQSSSQTLLTSTPQSSSQTLLTSTPQSSSQSLLTSTPQSSSQTLLTSTPQSSSASQSHSTHQSSSTSQSLSTPQSQASTESHAIPDPHPLIPTANNNDNKQLPVTLDPANSSKEPIIKYEPVQIVPAISAAGKSDLENSKDTEYLAIKGKNYETPSFTSQIINNFPAGVTTPATSVNYSYNNGGDANLWQNVEYHRYGNNIMEAHQYLTPAKFTVNEYGDTVAHAPQDSTLQMITQVPQIQSINFLDLEDKNSTEDLENDEKDSVFNNFLSFPY